MTTTETPRSLVTSTLDPKSTGTWHRPLLWLGAVCGVLALVLLVASFVDPQQILGQNRWYKPLKFAISIGIYVVTFAWLLQQLTRWRRFGNLLGTLTVIALTIEIIIIVYAAATHTTSHFNFQTPLSSALFTTMGISIVVVWLACLLVAVMILFAPGPDAARTLAVRVGVGLGLVGMALAFLMVGPTSEQLRDFQGIAGAHAVGVADGGQGLPFFGWSTEGGDLRVPHFIGMHALQIFPLGLLVLELLARRVPVLRNVRVRWGVVLVGAIVFAALLVVLTVQALAGESVVHPSALTAAATALVAGAGVVAATIILFVGVRTDARAARRASVPEAS